MQVGIVLAYLAARTSRMRLPTTSSCYRCTTR
jgi:alkanesulfonate monooxygenase SsuD/methylene tetrahydromethanopterin reductase-like flavin-dependent oxidoreductase (luciferase family)